MKVRQLTSRFGLPLLAKELIEQAARKRTYVIRVAYASLLFLMAMILFHDTLRLSSGNPLAALGHGRRVFEVVMGLQFAGVYLFMPAISCSVFTQEKERSSLMLLFLTRLGAWTIVLEKFLSRLVPMLCFLLLSLPLLGFAYSLGGITSANLWTGVWMLAVTAAWCGSLAVCCSAWFRTTVGAFVGSYLIGIALLIGPFLCAQLLFWGRPPHTSPVLSALVRGSGIGSGIYNDPDQVLFLFFAPVQYFDSFPTTNQSLAIILRSVPILLSSGFFLVLARLFVVRRASAPPRNLLLKGFRWADRTFARLNENPLTRGIVLVRNESPLPDEEPVAWRETTKRSLGRSRYLFRIFLAIEIPLSLVLMAIAFIEDGDMNGISLLLLLLWIVTLLIVAVQGASLIAGERTHQTLDVLATIPVSGQEILLQKFRAVRRLVLVLFVPFVTILLFQVSWMSEIAHVNRGSFDRRMVSLPLYLACGLLSVAIYLPMAAWLSTLIGLVVRTQARAIIWSVGAIIGWCILPPVVIVMPIVLLLDLNRGPAEGWAFLMLLSPMMIVALNESRQLHEFAGYPWAAVAVNFMAYGFMLLLIRQLCLTNADRFLGRAESR